MKQKIIALLLAFALLLTFAGCAAAPAAEQIDALQKTAQDVLDNLAVAEEEAAIETQEPPIEATVPEVTADETPEAAPDEAALPEEAAGAQEAAIDEDGSYTGKEDVALYIHTYGHLPGNFITKKQAQDLGWEGGSLEPYAPGMCIGGSRFGNYEGILPEKEGRSYTECDIDTLGADKRGAKRIVFSNDGLIYYTQDHYETVELLYGEEG